MDFEFIMNESLASLMVFIDQYTDDYIYILNVLPLHVNTIYLLWHFLFVVLALT